MAKKKVEIIELKKIDIRNIEIKVVGDSPVMLHAWSEKAKRQMMDKQNGVAKVKKKEPRNPQKEYAQSLYWLDAKNELIKADGDPDKHKYGFGIPSVSFKSAAVSACRNIDGIPMTLARGVFHVKGEYVPILTGKKDEYAKPRMREDLVVVSNGSPDFRYRGEFYPWHCNLTIRYNAGVLNAEQIINLLNVAGFACGVGEWRPSSQATGNHGMFHVE